MNTLAGFRNTFEICRYKPEDNTRQTKYFVTSSEHFIFPNLNADGPVVEGMPKKGFPNFTDIKLAQKKVCLTLKELFPNGKILIITRGFRGVLLSGYSQFIRMGGTLTFDQFCKLTDQNIDDFYNYDYLIEIYFQIFGEDNVIVLPFELLLQSKSQFLAHLEEILGLEHFEEEIGVHNKSMTGQDLFWHLWLSGITSKLLSIFGKRVYNFVFGKYVRLLLHFKLQPLFVFLKKMMPNKSINNRSVPENILYKAGKHATILKKIPIYKPFLKDYYLPSDN
ncbi:hypothetical protein [Rhodohalobacter sp. 614A]|uniref:hypothetical protein n=1 Tax=Rhodohalobacter sp. 614A TaxID=2908649 RepID=UPI001F2F2111|nr:hypothetical protein [Rhodohalobacter sp. 614A]